MEQTTTVNDIIRQAILGLEFALAYIEGQPHCTCGRWQWTGTRWLMKQPIGGQIVERDDEGHYTEAVCCYCHCWCNPFGVVVDDRPALECFEPVAGDEVVPGDTSIAGTGYRVAQKAEVG